MSDAVLCKALFDRFLWPQIKEVLERPSLWDTLRTTEGSMKCPKCNADIGDPFQCEHIVLQSGSGFNQTFGTEEHWFEIEATCPECGEKFTYGDSSL